MSDLKVRKGTIGGKPQKTPSGKLAANSQERTFKGFGKEKLERIFGPKPKGAKK